MNSQRVVLATAIAVSGTVILLSLFRDKNFQLSVNHEDSTKPTLRPCIYLDGKRREKKKKKVRFAENVKDSKKIINDGAYNSGMMMPANRMTLDSGNLKSRVRLME